MPLRALIAITLIASCRLGFDADEGGSSVDGAVSDGGSEPTPLARWRINEGAGATTLVDDTPDPVNLPLDYVGISPMWAEGAGGLHLDFAGAAGVDSGGARAGASGTKLDALHGRRSVTVETKHEWIVCDDQDPRVIEISTGEVGTDYWLSVRENANQEVFALRMAGSVGWTTYAYDVAGGCLRDGPHVFHWVLETDALDTADVVRAYIDGERTPVSLTTGPEVEPGATLDLGPGERRVGLSRPHTTTRTHNGRVWYAAFYAEALSDEVIAARAAALMADDD